MRRAALLCAALAASCTMSIGSRALDAARAADADALAARDAGFDDPTYAKKYVVFQNGDVAGAAPSADEAVRAAEAKAPNARHRFVFRPADRGPRFYRMTYVAEGGVVAGRAFLAALGLETVGGAGRPMSLRRTSGVPRGEASASPRIAVEVAAPGATTRRTIDVAIDPDFDGGLLLTPALAASLSLERCEIPGMADVQVALGRPFQALRATVIVAIPALSASGPVEAVYETAPARN